MYILFEGIDTCGKTTQIELLKQKMDNIIVTREPGGTKFGKRAREILLSGDIVSNEAEILLFLADRAEHYKEIVEPNRDKNIVISDRGFLSGIGYAMAKESMDRDRLIDMNRFALSNRFPEAIILFKTDIDTLKERLNTKTKDAIEDRGIEYLMRVQDEMQKTLTKLKDISILEIDATKSIDEIHTIVLNYIKGL